MLSHASLLGRVARAAAQRQAPSLASRTLATSRALRSGKDAPVSPAAAKMAGSSPSPDQAEKLASSTSAADLHPLPDSVKAAAEPSPAESNASADGEHAFPNLAAKNAAVHESRPAAPGAEERDIDPRKAAPGVFSGKGKRSYHTTATLRAVAATKSTAATAAARTAAAPTSAAAATPTPQQSAAPAASTAAPDVPADTGAGVDAMLQPFHGMSTQPFDERIASVLSAPLDPLDIEIKPDGLIYLPEIKYRRILNKAFGPGGWGLAPRGETNVGPRIVSREWMLVCLGRFVSTARGEQEYFDPSGIATASEGAKSNALMRCCKDLGIASELWDPRFIREFKAKHGVEVWAEGAGGKKKKLWRRKDQPPFEYPWKEKASGFGA